MQISNGYNIFEKIIFVYHLQKSTTVQHFEKGSQNLFEKIERFSRKFCIPNSKISYYTSNSSNDSSYTHLVRKSPFQILIAHENGRDWVGHVVHRIHYSSCSPSVELKQFKIDHYTAWKIEKLISKETNCTYQLVILKTWIMI